MALDTYRMMRKLGLPKEAVMLKMRAAELRTQAVTSRCVIIRTCSSFSQHAPW